MTVEAAETQFESIEARLAVLKAQLAALEAAVKQWKRSTPPKTLGDLRGILAGRPDLTEEEIDAALYRFDWEGESSDEMTKRPTSP